ncbi:MAG: hypothetical protein WBF40_08000, partial [Methyloceanibacter sp.]
DISFIRSSSPKSCRPGCFALRQFWAIHLATATSLRPDTEGANATNSSAKALRGTRDGDKADRSQER